MNSIGKNRFVLYLALLFLAGMVTGASLSWSLAKKNEFKPGPKDLVQHFQRRLQSQLDLTVEQVEKIQPIVARAVQSMASIHEQARPQIDQVFTNLNEELAKHLTADQQEKLKEMERKRLEAHKLEPRPR